MVQRTKHEMKFGVRQHGDVTWQQQEAPEAAVSPSIASRSPNSADRCSHRSHRDDHCVTLYVEGEPDDVYRIAQEQNWDVEVARTKPLSDISPMVVVSAYLGVAAVSAVTAHFAAGWRRIALVIVQSSLAQRHFGQAWCSVRSRPSFASAHARTLEIEETRVPNDRSVRGCRGPRRFL